MDDSYGRKRPRDGSGEGAPPADAEAAVDEGPRDSKSRRRGAGAGGPAHPVVESTLAVLYQKLEQARLELLRTTTTEAAAPLVSLVKDLASAIASLRSLPA